MFLNATVLLLPGLTSCGKYTAVTQGKGLLDGQAEEMNERKSEQCKPVAGYNMCVRVSGVNGV